MISCSPLRLPVSLMPSYIISLKQRVELAHHTMGFVFDKPNDFAFTAGQFGGFVLTHTDEKQTKNKLRSFTLVSPPYADELMFVTRIRDSVYKNTLMYLPLGAEVKLNAPFGCFTLHRDVKTPAVFIAGGIGVAPARSMALQAAKEQQPQAFYLFYSNRRPEDAPFLQEFAALQQTNPRFRFIPTFTQTDPTQLSGQGETGYISKAMLARHISDLTLPVYYICGPSAMVAAMRRMLSDAGVDETKIVTEEFSGYT